MYPVRKSRSNATHPLASKLSAPAASLVLKVGFLGISTQHKMSSVVLRGGKKVEGVEGGGASVTGL